MSYFPPPRPYPPELYSEPGEVSARWRSADEPHDLLNAGSCDYLATGDGTGGAFGLYRWNMGPGQGGPGPHFHRTMSESFYILTGTVTLHDGTRWRGADPGDFVYVPPGGVHGFRNDSDAPASMLILFSPGAPREAYFEGLAEIARTGKHPTEDEMTEFYRAHDNFWVDG